MKTLKLAALSVALLVAMSATSFAQVAGRGGRGGGGAGGAAGGAGGFAVMGVAPALSQMAALVGATPPLVALFVGTAAVNDSATLVKAVAINTKYQPLIQLGRVTRAGTPADSLVAKSRVATADRNKELRELLRSDDDKKKFDENVVAQTAGRGGN